MNLPEEIESTYLELAAFDERIGGKQTRARSRELEITLTVTTAQDPTTGKLLLTNDKQREAAVANALADDQEYSELAAEIPKLKADKRTLEARLERLRMEWRQEMQAADHRNAMLQMQAADAILKVRYYQLPRSEEIELPF